MITRAQAEALLTLAESLEACERLGVTVEQDYEDASICYGGKTCISITAVTSISIRLAVNSLAPKRSGRLPDPPNYQRSP